MTRVEFVAAHIKAHAAGMAGADPRRELESWFAKRAALEGDDICLLESSTLGSTGLPMLPPTMETTSNVAKRYEMVA